MIDVIILTEPKRGCGYRKSGPGGVGMYLMGDAFGEACERLPFPLKECPTCGGGIHFSRSFTWITPRDLFDPEIDPKCVDYVGHNHTGCPICNPANPAFPEMGGLMWIGQNNYSPQSFAREAFDVGISRRISSIPRGFEFGRHYVYLAHKKALTNFGKKASAGVFHVFKPTHVDLVIDDENDIPEKAVNLVERHGKNVRVVKVIKEGDDES